MRANRTFALFFMVLDLRLVKIGCRETINFFCIYPQVHYLLHAVTRATEAIPFSEDQVANTSKKKKKKGYSVCHICKKCADE